MGRLQTRNMEHINTEYFQRLVDHLREQIELEVERRRLEISNAQYFRKNTLISQSQNGNPQLSCKPEEYSTDNSQLVKKISDLEDQLQLERNSLLSIKRKELLKQREVHQREIKRIKYELVKCSKTNDELKLEMKGRSNDFEEMSNILQQKLIELMEQNQTLEKSSLKKTSQLENLTDKCKRLESRLGKLTHELKLGNERNRRLRNELISCSSKMKTGLKSALMGEIKTVENSLGKYMAIKNNVLTDQSYRLKILENPIDHERKCLGTPIVPKWPRCNIRRRGNTRQLLGSAQKSKNDYYQDENSGSSNSRFVKECEGPSFSLNDSTNSLKLDEVVILSD